MLKIRLHGESNEIETMVEHICNHMPNVRVLSVSGHYKDRGASVYERCYLDVVLNEVQPSEAQGIKQITGTANNER